MPNGSSGRPRGRPRRTSPRTDRRRLTVTRCPQSERAHPRGEPEADLVTWSSGEGGAGGWARPWGGVTTAVTRVRRGWRWDPPRPHGWPEQGGVVPAPASDLGWARQEPVRTLRWLIQRGLLLPFTEVMAHPKVEGREWVRELDRPVIFAANHSSHADPSLILHALSDRARDRTVVPAAADYWFKRPVLGNLA